MRILRVAQKCYPDVTGGGPYHVHALSRDQAAMGHDVTVLTVRSDPTLSHVDRRHGYTILRYDPAVTLLGNDISPGIAQFLATASYDIVHAHSHLYFSTNLAALSRRVAALSSEATPLAITNHGLYSQTAPEWVFEWYLRTLGRWTLDQADVVFCYTEADEQRLREFRVSADIAVVPNGIDTERFDPEGPERQELAGDGPAVLFVGRLVEGKRPADAIRAVKRLRDSHPEAQLYLCGDGPLREDLATMAGEETVFLGELPYAEMPAVYRAADAFVLPSRAEGTPRTVLEALACGTPVACSALPNLRGAFGDSVSYFELEDVDAICEQLLRLLSGEKPPDTTVVPDWQTTVERTTERLARIEREVR